MDSNHRIHESKSCALPLGDTPTLFRKFSCRTSTYRSKSLYGGALTIQFTILKRYLLLNSAFSYKTLLRDFLCGRSYRIRTSPALSWGRATVTLSLLIPATQTIGCTVRYRSVCTSWHISYGFILTTKFSN